MVDIDWELVCEVLDMHDDDAEGAIHELVHAYDCIGEEAFDTVGSQKAVNSLIEQKYGDDDCEEANISEVRTSAVTQLVMENLGLLTPDVEREIISSLYTNIRDDWFKVHTRLGTEEMLEAFLADGSIKNTAATLTQFLTSNFQKVQDDDVHEDD